MGGSHLVVAAAAVTCFILLMVSVCPALEQAGNLLTSPLLPAAQELRREIEVMDGRGMKQEGPRLVVRCWTDPAFEARLLQVRLIGTAVHAHCLLSRGSSKCNTECFIRWTVLMMNPVAKNLCPLDAPEF